MNFLQATCATFRENAKDKREVSQKTMAVFVAALLALTILVLPEAAMAEPWDGVAESILDIFTGGLARTIAIIAIIACGVMAMVGKLSWQWVIYIVVGLCLIFGAAAIADFFIGAAGG